MSALTTDQKTTILIVEDDELAAQALQARLENLDYDVIGIAGDGQQALQLTDQHLPDLILMDIVLPGEQDGIAVAEIITQKHGTPIIYVTAYADNKLLERAKITQPYGYLLKPVATNALRAAITVALYRDHAEQQLQNMEWGADVCERMSVAVIAVDTQFRITYINTVAQTLMPHPPGTLMGTQWQAKLLTTSGSNLPDVTRSLRNAIQGEPSTLYADIRLKTSQGIRTYTLQAIPLIRAQRRKMGAALLLHDDTSQLEAQEALHRTQESYNHLLSNLAGIAYHCCWQDEWVMDYVSDGCLALTGYSAEALTHAKERSYHDLIHKDFQQPHNELQGQQPGPMKSCSIEYIILTAQGEEKWVWDQYRTIRDSSGKTVEIEGFITDITERKLADQRAEESRQYLKALFEASPDMLFIHATDGRIIDVNNNSIKNYGYSRDELLKMNVAQFSAPDYTQEMATNYINSVLRGEAQDFPWRARRKDGSEFPVEVRLRLLHQRNYEGNQSIIAVVRDLSELDHLESALKTERDFSSAVLETVGSIVVVLDREGSIVRFNTAAQIISGYSASEALGRKVWDFLLPKHVIDGVKTTFSRLTAGNFPNHYTNEWLTHDGELRMINWYNSALTDADGKVEYVIATGIDFTQQHRAEQALASVETQWNEAIEFFAEPIHLVDLKDRVIRANRAFFDLVGKAPQDVIGKNIVDIMHPQGEREKCPVCSTRHALKDAVLVLEADHPENSLQRAVEISLRVIHDINNKPQSVLTGIRDLTDQRCIEAELRQHRDHLETQVKARTQALTEANQDLESFSYSVSHDLRAPLRGIDGFSQVLLEEYESIIDDKGKDYLRRVRKASQRMGILIDDMLLISRVGRGAMKYSSVDLSALATASLSQLQASEPARQVDINIEAGLTAQGDVRMLELVLENLIGNAWKFTSKRERSHIEFGALASKPGEVSFFVKDNGAGFDMAYSTKLFGAFQRLHSPNEFEGTGVGLATVKRIIKRHGGRVWAQSTPDEGATFFFSLPTKPTSLH